MFLIETCSSFCYEAGFGGGVQGNLFEEHAPPFLVTPVVWWPWEWELMALWELCSRRCCHLFPGRLVVFSTNPFPPLASFPSTIQAYPAPVSPSSLFSIWISNSLHQPRAASSFHGELSASNSRIREVGLVHISSTASRSCNPVELFSWS